MSTKTTTIIAVIIIAFTFLLGAFLYDGLPDQVASHWGKDGEVDGYMDKFWGVFLMPTMSVLLLGMFLVIPKVDPLRENIEEFRRVFNLFILFFILFLGYVWALTMLWNFYEFNMSLAITPAIGLLYIFIGYMLDNAKKNWFIGIRNPWTLSSDTVWEKTHAIGGKLFIVSGALSFFGAFFEEYAVWFMLLPVLGTTAYLYIYSYLLYQKETK